MKKRLLGGTVEALMKGGILTGVSLHAMLYGGQETDTFGKVAMVVVFLLGAGFLFWAMTIIKDNHRRYQAFFDRFPELNGQLSGVEERALFIDKQFGLAIYKQYLIAYRSGRFNAVPLDRVAGLAYDRIGGSLRRLPQAFLVAQMKDGGRPEVLDMNPITLNDPKLWLQELYEAIAKDFPAIIIK